MKVVIIGSGGLATQLATALYESGLEIIQVYSQTISNAKLLADKVNASYTSEIDAIFKHGDIYFYALKDSVLEDFINKISFSKKSIHLHTAGSIPMSLFRGFVENYGVFYPYQTFSKAKKVNFEDIPICIEGNSLFVEENVIKLAKTISKNIYIINSDQREKLHLAAVFACNFTNYLYDVSSEIIKNAGFNHEIIQPLINETAEKIKTMTPFDAQTGPAKRGDKLIATHHLKLLSWNKRWKNIYKLLSKCIYLRHQKASKRRGVNYIISKIKLIL